MKISQIISAVVMAIGVWVGLSSLNTGPKPPCYSDWSKCADNADLINNNADVSLAQMICKSTAIDRARFGTPEWPHFVFGKFRIGSDYTKSGVITLIEDKAKFQNLFGAMASSTVTCDYDLKRRAVTSISVEAN